jgi:hypothetical protein
MTTPLVHLAHPADDLAYCATSDPAATVTTVEADVTCPACLTAD